MKHTIFLIFLLPTTLFAQSAIFSTDTSYISKIQDSKSDSYKKIMGAEWRINGQILTYGSKPVSVFTDNKLDTIYYKQFSNSKWDTIICNINKPGKYKFYFNACCGGFNVADETRKFINGSVVFKIIGADKLVYLGTLGETGMLINSTTQDTLQSGCRSAMSPNVYQLSFREISNCTDTTNCTEGICLYEKGKEELNYDFSFKTISLKLDCLFMPLSSKPIKIIYNTITDRITIE